MVVEISCGKCPIWSFCQFMKKDLTKVTDGDLSDYCPLVRSAAFSFALLVGEYDATVAEMFWWIGQRRDND